MPPTFDYFSRIGGLLHTVAMMPRIYKLDELDVEESFCPDTLIGNVTDASILI